MSVLTGTRSLNHSLHKQISPKKSKRKTLDSNSVIHYRYIPVFVSYIIIFRDRYNKLHVQKVLRCHVITCSEESFTTFLIDKVRYIYSIACIAISWGIGSSAPPFVRKMNRRLAACLAIPLPCPLVPYMASANPAPSR